MVEKFSTTKTAILILLCLGIILGGASVAQKFGIFSGLKASVVDSSKPLQLIGPTEIREEKPFLVDFTTNLSASEVKSGAIRIFVDSDSAIEKITLDQRTNCFLRPVVFGAALFPSRDLYIVVPPGSPGQCAGTAIIRKSATIGLRGGSFNTSLSVRQKYYGSVNEVTSARNLSTLRISVQKEKITPNVAILKTTCYFSGDYLSEHFNNMRFDIVSRNATIYGNPVIQTQTKEYSVNVLVQKDPGNNTKQVELRCRINDENAVNQNPQYLSPQQASYEITFAPDPLCGNAVLEYPHESCDNGPNGDDSCTGTNPGPGIASCSRKSIPMPPFCGDGIVQAGETCDPKNDGACSRFCTRFPSNATTYPLFATSQIINGKMGGREKADEFCQDAAATAKLDGKWTALLSSPSKTIEQILYGLSPKKIVLLDGTVIADNADDFLDGTFKAAPNITEFLDPATRYHEGKIWTGSTRGGTTSENYCQKKTPGIPSKGSISHSNWTALSGVTEQSCSNLAGLFCLRTDSSAELPAEESMNQGAMNANTAKSFKPSATSPIAKNGVKDVKITTRSNVDQSRATLKMKAWKTLPPGIPPPISGNPLPILSAYRFETEDAQFSSEITAVNFTIEMSRTELQRKGVSDPNKVILGRLSNGVWKALKPLSVNVNAATDMVRYTFESPGFSDFILTTSFSNPAPVCGNGVEEPGEFCDDGNQNNGDECTNTCQIASCGDGFIKAGAEACDDGNTHDFDQCSSTCTIPPACLDGIDNDGDGFTDYPDDMGCDTHHDTHEEEPSLPGTSTGKIVIQLKTVPETIAAQIFPFKSSGNGIPANFQLDTDALTSSPGLTQSFNNLRKTIYRISEIVPTGFSLESIICDGGHPPGMGSDVLIQLSPDETVTCEFTNRKLNFCGNGIRELLATGWESCDDGNTIDADSCTNACKYATCGDKLVRTDLVNGQPAELCDDGQYMSNGSIDNDGCGNDCRNLVSPGNRISWECNQVDLTTRRVSCKFVLGRLTYEKIVGGDLRIFIPKGNIKNMVSIEKAPIAAAVNPRIFAALTSSPVLNTGSSDVIGYEIEARFQDAASSYGAVPYPEIFTITMDIGDNVMPWTLPISVASTLKKNSSFSSNNYVLAYQAWQDFDISFPINNTSLRARLQNTCGNGVTEAANGEGCDDGNAINDDATCTNACTIPRCGDGIPHAGESCDDGNSLNTDGCLQTCQVARCGDGFIRTGAEECDGEQDLSGNNACSSQCQIVGKLALKDTSNLKVYLNQPFRPLDIVDIEKSASFKRIEFEDSRLDAWFNNRIGPIPFSGNGVSAVMYPSVLEEVTMKVTGLLDNNRSTSKNFIFTVTQAVCGNRIKEGNEVCDDPDGKNGEIGKCTTTCALPICGDKKVNRAEETCDDPDGKNGDIDKCTSSCSIPSCGDAIKNRSSEQCDTSTNIDPGTGTGVGNCSKACELLGEISLFLDTTPNDAEDFKFSIDTSLAQNGLTPGEFLLDDDNNADHPNDKKWSSIRPGTYTLTLLTPPSGFNTIFNGTSISFIETTRDSIIETTSKLKLVLNPGEKISITYLPVKKSQCSDSIDNDLDGKIDFGTADTNDTGCANAEDNDERNMIASSGVLAVKLKTLPAEDKDFAFHIAAPFLLDAGTSPFTLNDASGNTDRKAFTSSVANHRVSLPPLPAGYSVKNISCTEDKTANSIAKTGTAATPNAALMEFTLEPGETVTCEVTVIKNNVCGNSTTDSREECDDGNTDAADACTNTCTNADCGDKIIRQGVEECDLGKNPDGSRKNGTVGEKCTASCKAIPFNIPDLHEEWNP